jgi:hypothetical protein
MKRWNVEKIFFMGMDDAFREITLDVGRVNIITGASGTGKSAIIKALDYCLGSSKCGLPVHIRRHCLAVGTKWVRGADEMIVARQVPRAKQKSSDIMYITTGRQLSLPRQLTDLEGRANVSAVKAILERAFGIGDLRDESSSQGEDPTEKATVRKVTPYLFVTKEVIDSETVLLHGLDDNKKAPGIISSLPYFLGASSETAVTAERKLRQLRRALEIELQRERVRISNDSLLKQRTEVLLSEAVNIGLLDSMPSTGSEADLISIIKETLNTSTEASQYPNDNDLRALHQQRKDVLGDLNQARRKLRNTQLAAEESKQYGDAVTSQREKLQIAEHLGLDKASAVCPICASPTSAGTQAAEAIKRSLSVIREESSQVKVLLPRIDAETERLSEKVATQSNELRTLDAEITATVNRLAEGKRLKSLGELHAYYRGKVAYFLESTQDELLKPAKDFSHIQDEISFLEGQVDAENRKIRLRRAEDAVSRYATDIFSRLPKEEPCIDAELQFSARDPQINIIEPGPDGDILSMPDIGSDQNYLAVHIALAFGLQRFFEKEHRPVPGLLVLDQISRPYFPSTDDDETEEEYDDDSDAIFDSETGRDVISISADDADFRAMRQHIDFLFDEVKVQEGLQVILLEHAFFKDDPRYVESTKEHWTRASGKALIPRNWKRRMK